MLALLAAALIAPTPQLSRTILPNGAAVFVESMPGQKQLSLQLFASAKYAPETAATHGYRHLLEHLLAQGEQGDLDKRLESEGAFLQAETMRDAMTFEISLPPDRLDLGLAAIGELLRPFHATQAEIDREAEVIGQEIALESDASVLAASAWTIAFGDDGLDPLGDMDTIRTATPEKLAELHARQFAPSALTLVVVGDVDSKSATASLSRALEMPPDAFKPIKPRSSGKPGRIECQCTGEARAAACGPFGGETNVAELAAAFAIASELDGAFVTYTPSEERALITVGRTDQSSGVGLYIDSLTKDDVDGLMLRGLALARSWLRYQLESPESDGALRGLLISERRAASPTDFSQTLDMIDVGAFERAVDAFRKDKAVIAVGVR